MEATSKTLTASCHCKSIQFTITIPTDYLPLKRHICHCSICRHTHGAPASFHTELPHGIEPQFAPSSLDGLTAYEHPAARSTRHFCGTCGCQVGDRAHNGQWIVSHSIFDANKHEQGIWQFQTHLLPSSAADGGLSTLIPEIDGRQLEMVNPESSQQSTNEPPIEASDSKLLAKCHCGGVAFTISRPSEEFIASPASQGWLHPADKSKWLACWDLCNDCRLVTGSHVIGWMFVPLDHISPRPPADFMVGSSKVYRSSEGVVRTFCGTCGATVSYSCSDRPQIIDVAVGILRAPEGVMAENWALWRGRLAWPQDGLDYDEAFARSLIEGSKQWGRERGQPEDFIIAG